MGKWLVIRFDFNEDDMQFRRGGCIEFNSDEELMNFIKSVMSNAGITHLWQITKIKEE